MASFQRQREEGQPTYIFHPKGERGSREKKKVRALFDGTARSLELEGKVFNAFLGHTGGGEFGLFE